MICPRCGWEFYEDVVNCPKCGAELEEFDFTEDDILLLIMLGLC